MKPNKREEEQKILAEMEKAMQENGQADSQAQLPQKRIGPFKDKTPEKHSLPKMRYADGKGKVSHLRTHHLRTDGRGEEKACPLDGRWGVLGGFCHRLYLLALICPFGHTTKTDARFLSVLPVWG